MAFPLLSVTMRMMRMVVVMTVVQFMSLIVVVDEMSSVNPLQLLYCL